MGQTGPVFTTENECQDCYKCVRHCHCKAIRIVNGKASVIPEACVSCGECVKVCPAHAKKIRSDLGRLRFLLEGKNRVIASLAPSWVGYFPNTNLDRLARALKRIGFEGISETALGAEALSAETCAWLRKTKRPLVISTACPAAVDYIRKYMPQYTGALLPFYSPVISHCRLLRKQLGNEIKIAFFGPCAAKKNESDQNQGLLDLALTFSDLAQLLEENGLQLNDSDCDSIDGDFALESDRELLIGKAEEGRFYSVEGGMNDTLRNGNDHIRYTAVSGLDNLFRILHQWNGNGGDRTIFLEALACRGGCVNGPDMPARASSLDVLFQTDRISSAACSEGKISNVPLDRICKEDPLAEWIPSEEEMERALARVGKYGRSDELNCGACGYNTCRDFARALLQNKAEEAMCHNYLRKNYERTSNALIKYIPAAVVIVNNELQITECNRIFADLAGDSVVFDSLGNLDGISIQIYLPEYAELFTSVLENGGEIEKYNQKYQNRILNLSVFTIARGKFAGAVIQDVTRKEFQREQAAAKAREVIQKNVLTVQKVARLFGEHIAETEIMLHEIAKSCETENGETDER
ncbi:MAG: [Fe-Fe] hydrogenase large subunit C-terminal domain-containing protein [Planctomycetia bacterium]|nr:[Fe-Fe] hydrogenase large subunit C-terminal domain-containing protein [Planctomycetia bacterium]